MLKKLVGKNEIEIKKKKKRPGENRFKKAKVSAMRKANRKISHLKKVTKTKE